MAKKIKIAILISGRGSNMQALVNACEAEDFPAEVVLVLSNRPGAKGLEFAKQKNIATSVIDHKEFSGDRVEFDKKMDEEIEKSGAGIVCLAGFMRLVSGWFAKKWENKLINIHPSFLPEFKGANAVEDALKAGAKQSGCSVHFVVEEMDAGEIIDQIRVPVLENDTKDSLAARILEKEHVIYVAALAKLCKNMLNADMSKYS